MPNQEEIVQGITEKIGGWKELFKKVAENRSGVEIPEAAADLGYMQLLERGGGKITGEDLKKFIAKGSETIGPFTLKERAFLQTKNRQFALQVAEKIEMEMAGSDWFEQQLADNYSLVAEPYEDPNIYSPVGILLHQIGKVPAMEVFYQAARDPAHLELPDIFSYNPFAPYNSIFKVFKAIDLRKHPVLGPRMEEFGL